MNIKKRIFAALVLGGCMAVPAMAQKQMTTFFNNGTAESVIGVADIVSLHFSDGNLLIKQKADSKQTATSLAEILSIKFIDKDASKINEVSAGQLSAVNAVATENTLMLLGYDTANTSPAAIFGISGAMYFSTPALTTNSIDISSLPKGIYILKLGNKSYKIRK